MSIDRRGFFSLLSASGAVAAVKDVPEPDKAEIMTPDDESVFVLSYHSRMSDTAALRIQEVWMKTFGPHPPRLIILEEGMTLQKMRITASPAR